MATRTLMLGILIHCCLVWFGTGLQAREWVDATGKFRVEAELVRVEEGKAKLKLDDGRIVEVPVNRLSEADQKFIAASQQPKIDAKKAAQAALLVDQAVVLLELDARNNATLIDSKLREATRLNPANIEAEFLRGIYHLLISAHPDRAADSFANCLKQQPHNGAVLNNLALAKLKGGLYGSAVQYFEKASEAAPGLSAISQNLGRAMAVHNDGRMTMPDRVADQFGDLYARVVASEKFPAAEPELGWVLVRIKPQEQRPAESNLPKEITHGGTGFVVAGDFLVTNKHVVEDVKQVKIRVPSRKDDKLLEGSVVAVSDTVDVAVVKCPGLNLPPAKVVAAIPRRGSDVMVLGFPQFWQLGASIKSTRGAVTSLPAKETDNMLLIDAEMNSGNSGGPIANKSGRVVAIATAVFKPTGGTGGRYGAGIPIASQLEFLKEHIPAFATDGAADAELAWPDVDEQVSKSTVLILVAGSKPAVKDNFAGMFFDPTCPGCNGKGKIETPRGDKLCAACRGVGLDRIAMLSVAARRARLLREQEIARGDENPAPPPETAPGVRLTSASYGTGGATKDVTQLVQKVLEKDPFTPIQPDNRSFGDPASGRAKRLTLQYTVDGKAHSVSLNEKEVTPFPPWPAEGKTVPDAAVDFQIVAVRYGAGLTWQDVTSLVRGRLRHPAEEIHWAGVAVGDPWHGVRKRIAVWFDYQGKRYCKLFYEGDVAALLDSSLVTRSPQSPKIKTVSQEYVWQKEKPTASDLLPADEKFFLISHLAGNYGGLGEEIRIHAQSRRKWILDGKAHLYVAGKVREIATELRSEFEPEVTEFHWKRGQARVKMIHHREGFCFLSRVTGNFAGGGESVRVNIDPDDGFWYLSGRTQQPMAASAIAMKLKKNSQVKLQFAEFVWTPARGKVRMLPTQEGIAFVSGMGGNFAGYGEQVEVTEKDGYWWLGGVGQKAIVGRGYTVRVVSQ